MLLQWHKIVVPPLGYGGTLGALAGNLTTAREGMRSNRRTPKGGVGHSIDNHIFMALLVWYHSSRSHALRLKDD